jgi:hypothetical protein
VARRNVASRAPSADTRARSLPLPRALPSRR